MPQILQEKELVHTYPSTPADSFYSSITVTSSPARLGAVSLSPPAVSHSIITADQQATAAGADLPAVSKQTH